MKLENENINEPQDPAFLVGAVSSSHSEIEDMNSNKTTKLSTKQRTTPFGNLLLAAIKNGRFKEWFYEWKHGYPFLLNEEVDIICKTREEPKFKHLNDREIQTLIAIRISDMYEKKYPNAKRWSLAHF